MRIKIYFTLLSLMFIFRLPGNVEACFWLLPEDKEAIEDWNHSDHFFWVPSSSDFHKMISFHYLLPGVWQWFVLILQIIFNLSCLLLRMPWICLKTIVCFFREKNTNIWQDFRCTIKNILWYSQIYRRLCSISIMRCFQSFNFFLLGSLTIFIFSFIPFFAYSERLSKRSIFSVRSTLLASENFEVLLQILLYCALPAVFIYAFCVAAKYLRFSAKYFRAAFQE
jgi:hypothetical protein